MKTENIVVIKTKLLFDIVSPWTGIIKPKQEILDLINSNYEIKPRNEMEEDEDYKQIIPYMIFKSKDELFLMQRGNNGGEKSLAEKYTLGIGGHIRKEDITSENIIDWGKREFEEEINYNGEFYKSKIIGLINDQNSKVGRVHLGIGILIEGEGNKISIKDEFQNGKMLNIKKCNDYFEKMEFWSQIIYKEIINNY